MKIKTILLSFLCLFFIPPNFLMAQITMDEFIGANTRREDPLPPVGFAREYHNWVLDEGFECGYSDYSPHYPGNQYKWNPPYQGRTSVEFDQYYASYNNAGIIVSPSMVGTIPQVNNPAWCDNTDNIENLLEQIPVKLGNSPDLATSYLEHADYLYHFLARYGQTEFSTNGETNIIDPKLHVDETVKTGMDLVRYLENWNEPDNFWDPGAYFTGGQFAAMMSADYDGHMGTMQSQIPINGTSYPVGVTNADSKVSFVMGGISELDRTYMQEIATWSETNRAGASKVYPFDVFNFHHYSDREPNGFNIAEHGFSPEEDIWNNKSLKYNMIQMIQDMGQDFDLTDFPKLEFWMSEFGYDTSPYSYQACIPDYDITPPISAGDNCAISNLRDDYLSCIVPYWPLIETVDQNRIYQILYEVQGQWLVRSILEMSATGFDRVMIFDTRDAPGDPSYCHDGDDNNPPDGLCDRSGVFSKSGLFGSVETAFMPKTSFYYVGTVKSLLTGYVFDNDVQTVCPDPMDCSKNPGAIVDCDNDFPRVYEYTNSNATTSPIYSFWSPTSCDKPEYTHLINLPAGTTAATLVELEDNNVNGKFTIVSSQIQGNQIEVMVSERPKFILLGQEIESCQVNAVENLSAETIACNAVNLEWEISPTAGCAIDHYILSYALSTNISDPMDVSPAQLMLYDNDLSGSLTEAFVSGLEADQCYWFYITPVSEDGSPAEPQYVAAATLPNPEMCWIDILDPSITISIPQCVGACPTNTYLGWASDFFNYGQVGNPNFCLECDYLEDGTPYPRSWIYDNAGGVGGTNITYFDVDLGQAYDIKSIALNDGTDAGEVQILYDDGSSVFQTWDTYFTDGSLYHWVYLTNAITPGIGIERLRFQFNSPQARIDKIVICGQANNEYEGCLSGATFPCTVEANFEVDVCNYTVQADADQPGNWDMGDGTTYTNVANILHSYSTTDDYDITFSVMIPCISECVTTVSIPEVNAPDATFDFDQQECNPYLQFIATDNSWNHLWEFEKISPYVALGSSQDINPSYNFPGPGNYRVIHTVTNDCGVVVVEKELTITECTPNPVCNCNQEYLGTINGTVNISGSILANPQEVGGKCIEINGKLIVDQSTTFTHVELVMHPGAEIRIKSGNTLYIAKNSSFHGCDEMWKGIYVDPGAGFYSSEEIGPNTIEDALIGIAANSPGNIYLNNTKFENNFIGYAQRGNGNTAIIQSEFLSTDFLLPNNTSYPTDFVLPSDIPVVLDWGYTGMFLENISQGWVDWFWGWNQISGSVNGIISRNNSITLSPNVSNLKINTAYDKEGFGIWAEGSGANNLSVHNASFSNCETGVFSKITGIGVSKTDMTNIKTGINIQSVTHAPIGIVNNEISADDYGIRLNSNAFPSSVNIFDNTIDVGKVPQASEYGKAAIDINLVQMSSFKITNFGEIRNNAIRVFGSNDLVSGIRFLNSFGFKIQENNIRLENESVYTPNRNGMYLIQSSGLDVSCNQITGVASDLWANGSLVGIDVISSSDVDYHCNSFDKTGRGMKFVGTCISSISANEFNTHEIGLEIENDNAIIGQQRHQGNLWNETDGVGAKNGATISTNLDLNSFSINQFSNCPTSVNELYPCNIDVNPSAGNPLDWFKILPLGVNDQIETCGFSGTCETGPECCYPEYNITNLDETIKEGTFQSTKYESETQWQLNRQLYRKLKRYPNLQNLSSFGSFYNNLIGSPLGELEEIQAQEALVFEPYIGLEDRISAIRSSIEKEVINIDSLIFLSWQSSGLDSIQLIATIQQEQFELRKNQNALKTLISSLYTDRQSKAISLQSNNASLQTTTIWEQNEKAVNDINLKSLFLQKLPTDPSQLATLQSIAIQCPIEGGPRPVYMARGILDILNITFVPDACEAEERNERRSKSAKNSPTLNLSPNPASDQIQISLNGLAEVESYLQITDLNGQILSSIAIQDDKYSFQVSTESFSPGIYFISLYQGKERIDTHKMIIQR